jgi:hypothetical protein
MHAPVAWRGTISAAAGRWKVSEMPSCYRKDTPKARINHICCECRGVIQKGETYTYHHGVWDGRGASFKMCVDCDELRVEVDRDCDVEDGSAFGDLYESVFNGRDSSVIAKFLAIKRKRGATIKPWMIEREAEILEKASR